MARKIGRSIVTLSAAAVAAVYAAGYLYTAKPSGDSAIASPPGMPSATAATVAGLLAGQPGTPRRLRDGQYFGIGAGRAGSIGVMLTVEGGKITGVRITTSTMHYPTKLIAKLPAEVIARQGASVDLVSGATFSSRAFIAAVADALARAAADEARLDAAS